MAYDISRREVPDQPIASIRDRSVAGHLPEFIGRSLHEIFARLRSLGVAPTGEPFVVYHAFGPTDVDAEVCVPIAGDLAANGRITGRVLPGAAVAETLHIGPYEELVTAYAALIGWIGRNGFEAAGPVRERYVDGPGDDVPAAAHRTVIQVPIAETAVLVR